MNAPLCILAARGCSSCCKLSCSVALTKHLKQLAVNVNTAGLRGPDLCGDTFKHLLNLGPKRRYETLSRPTNNRKNKSRSK